MLAGTISHTPTLSEDENWPRASSKKYTGCRNKAQQINECKVFDQASKGLLAVLKMIKITATNKDEKSHEPVAPLLPLLSLLRKSRFQWIPNRKNDNEESMRHNKFS